MRHQVALWVVALSLFGLAVAAQEPAQGARVVCAVPVPPARPGIPAYRHPSGRSCTAESIRGIFAEEKADAGEFYMHQRAMYEWEVKHLQGLGGQGCAPEIEKYLATRKQEYAQFLKVEQDRMDGFERTCPAAAVPAKGAKAAAAGVAPTVVPKASAKKAKAHPAAQR
ncbi:MAG: hypothetical protein NTX64_04105 [Elusimicrobia bacterium]|nr:hypothetical protein [Elusimicrobiota bacterium]